MRRCTAALVIVMAPLVVSCEGDSTTNSTTYVDAATTTVVSIPATASTSGSTSSTTATTSTTVASTSTTSTTITPEPECDAAEAVEILDETLELARLAPGGAWTDDTTDIAFADRTNTGEAFGDGVAFECSVRLTQRTDAGAERLALIAWNDLRHAAVIQATDPPSEPYDGDAVFQLYIEQPRGEFLVDEFVWAATMSGGESIVISTRDYSAAITAKSWQVAAPVLDDLPVTLDAEQHAIDALLAIGARNVAVAEPAPAGYPIGTIMFNTPLALSAFAVIGSSDSFDPMVPLLADADSTFHDAGPVTIRLTTGVELEMFDLYETGWACPEHSWRLYTGLGTPDELLGFTNALLESLQRTGNC